MSVLVVVAVDQERDAVLRDCGDADVTVTVSGVGPVAAATATTRALLSGEHSHVFSAGIAGGFAGRAEVGDLVVATSTVAADLGCRTDERFLTLADMGLDQDCLIALPDAASLCERLRGAGLAAHAGAVLTLSCMTGTDVDAKHLADRYPDARAEAMEGWGVAWAARETGTAFAEVRAISNIIGRRDPATWDLAASFDALSRAFAAILTGPLP